MKVFTNTDYIRSIKHNSKKGWKSYYLADVLIAEMKKEMTYIDLELDQRPELRTGEAEALRTAILEDIEHHIPERMSELHSQISAPLPTRIKRLDQDEELIEHAGTYISQSTWELERSSEEALTRLHQLQKMCGFNPLTYPGDHTPTGLV